ncbi:hypothetical protein [Noviherbaspirillum saxi]|uniref:Uncharacterized protein n=1 Tax=Noviherbaspirillum saxi TaxID=2320863 RepID=A0A3A3FYJ7_9BURK|nr:hypothetical protein [Noviherbaspirillum saxi]RJF92159.1 hypothetical protein D3871_26315 [Noviherbaspirillum saxi]
MQINDLPDIVTGAAVHPGVGTLRNWYSPWRYIHSSWLGGDGALGAALQRSDVLQRRLAYPAWCERFALARHPESIDGSVWWMLAFADDAVFQRADRLVGLAMLFAQHRSKSLGLGRDARACGASGDDVRWALSRACLIPGAVFEPDDLCGEEKTGFYGLASVKLALADSNPALFRRIALRYATEQVNSPSRTALVATGSNAHRAARILARLWGAALQHAGDG